MKSCITIDGWKTQIRFSSAHVIPEYEKCGRLHGHTYAVHAKVFGKIDEKGILLDFAVLKEVIKDVVKKLDHRILIPEKSGIVTIEKENDTIKLISLGKRYVFPKGDCVLLPIGSTSVETLSNYILEQVVDRISSEKQIEKIEIGVDEGFGQGAWVKKILER